MRRKQDRELDEELADLTHVAAIHTAKEELVGWIVELLKDPAADDAWLRWYVNRQLKAAWRRYNWLRRVDGTAPADE